MIKWRIKMSQSNNHGKIDFDITVWAASYNTAKKKALELCNVEERYINSDISVIAEEVKERES